MLARFLVWRLVELAATLVALAVVGWWLDGGLPRLLHRAHRASSWFEPAALLHDASTAAHSATSHVPWYALTLPLLALAGSLAIRMLARSQRAYVRLRVAAYRADETSVQGIVAMYESLHKRLLCRWWRRLFLGQPSLALEVHHDPARAAAWLALACPRGCERAVESALRGAYPNCSLAPTHLRLGAPPALVRLKKHAEPIKRASRPDRFEHERAPAVDRLMRAMASCAGPSYVQVALTPAPLLLERVARAAYKHHERRVGWRHEGGRRVRERSLYDEVELKGGLEMQHAPLFFADVRVIAESCAQAERIAAELCAHPAENRLVPKRTSLRQALLAPYDRRVQRGEGNPLPPLRRGVFSGSELAALWHLPSIDQVGVPFARASVPVAPAPPGVHRPRAGHGILRDAIGPVSIHEECRRQNTAVPGAVEQGKSSLLVASIAEDLRRERCAVVLLDPKGDAADAALSAVPMERTCTVLDFASPTCGFNPLAVHAPPDVVADYVVGALRNLFTDADIRASSDRYLRNAIIAALAYDRTATLWDAARLLSVGPDGHAFRAHVGARVRALPELKEITEFFTSELATQLEDARSTTTAKLDAPANKLARLLNSASIKRILLNQYLAVDLDRVIAGCEVLIVKGALGAMGAGNTSTLMQMIVGMLDAALARQQDRVRAPERVAVALKIDEAPLVINRGFAATLALKRSAGLETVACWQADSQWADREVRDQLDALFANRVYFATASVPDARAAAALLMAEFSDTVRPGIRNLSALGRPDARLHLPRHHAIVSFVTPAGRQSPFLARTTPMRVDEARITRHLARQAERGARYLDDLRQPHWERRDRAPARPLPADDASSAPAAAPSAHLASTSSSAASGASAPSVPPTSLAASPTPPAPVAKPPRRSAPGVERVPTTTPAPLAPAGDAPAHPPPASYSELVDLDRAKSMREVPPGRARHELALDPLDLDLLALLAQLRYVLASQLHRRFNGDRALTTTQRRLKRLADAGLLARVQFHRPDGAGIPMCCAITASGLTALRRATAGGASARPNRSARPADTPIALHQSRSPWTGCAPWQLAAPQLAGRAPDARAIGQVRREIHVAGWVLALARALDEGPQHRGRECSTIIGGGTEAITSPPARDPLSLPGGRVPHAFLRTAARGERVPVERFETIRPDAIVEARSPAGVVDLLVEHDDRLPVGAAARKLERYDHFLSGWATGTTRYGRKRCQPLVVFVCRDRARARECARRADAVVVAAQAYAGEYPSEWLYPGRERTLFAAERDVHERLLHAYGLPRLPPDVRVNASAGRDPRERAAACVVEPQLRGLLGVVPPLGTR